MTYLYLAMHGDNFCSASPRVAAVSPIAISMMCALLAGCGTTQSQRATEQLLLSDAVDRSVANLDFRALAGKTVYFDTTYLKRVKGLGFVNASYIISSLRQQMFSANCRVQEHIEDADYVMEARIGALGNDRHDVTYGLPANNSLNAAAAFMPNVPPMPLVPEISLAKRNDQMGAAKIVVFAYHRATRQPVWQSGIAVARSTAKDAWVLGAGPFQRGTIYDGTRFAGAKFDLPIAKTEEKGRNADPLVQHDLEFHFRKPESVGARTRQNPIRLATHERANDQPAPRSPAVDKTARSIDRDERDEDKDKDEDKDEDEDEDKDEDEDEDEDKDKDEDEDEDEDQRR